MDKNNPTMYARPDYLVCTCMGVMYYEIVAAIQAGADDLQALSNELMVATGCSSCVQEIFSILKEQKK